MPARLPVTDLAGACVAACALAAAEFRRDPDPVTIDMRRVATAFTSERHLRIAGRSFTAFAPASAFFRAADGWVRTHGNYPHHLARLNSALGPDIAAGIAALPALEVEERVSAAGGLAVAVRTPAEWAAHPQAVAVPAEPTLHSGRIEVRGVPQASTLSRRSAQPRSSAAHSDGIPDRVDLRPSSSR